MKYTAHCMYEVWNFFSVVGKYFMKFYDLTRKWPFTITPQLLIFRTGI